MTQEELLSVAEIIERLVKRFEEQGAEHARKMAEHRASFGARTETDAKIIEGLRQQIETLNREERAAHDARPASPTGGRVVPWAHCEPCDQPKATPVMPKPGDMVRLVSRPERDNVDKNLRTTLWWPWEDRWGVVGQTRKVVAGCRYIPGAVAVATDIYAHWPLSCVEVVSEATHDTPAGKEAAEAVIRSGEVVLGDVVEVVSASSCMTFSTDIGRRGKVTYIMENTIDVEEVAGYALPAGGVVAKRDVRKVPQ